MAQQGSKGSKGPTKVVGHRQGHTAGTSESPGMVPAPKKPSGTRGTKSGAR
jgi:hypothetical protein